MCRMSDGGHKAGKRVQWVSWGFYWLGKSSPRLCCFSEDLKGVKVKVLVAQSCPTICEPMDCSPPGSSVHGISRKECWSELPFPPPGDLPDPGMELESLKPPALSGGSLPLAPPKKPVHGPPQYYSQSDVGTGQVILGLAGMGSLHPRGLAS